MHLYPPYSRMEWNKATTLPKQTKIISNSNEGGTRRASRVSSVSGIFHVKELGSDLYTFTSLLSLLGAEPRGDAGPEMLVSVALLVTFKSTSRVFTMRARVRVHY